ncbi:hypothetical protein M758_UG009800 [Ceratodon purpureus]|nr:hypothetical protein M758_UG009800 [Ceratodon purpureus]
MSWNKGRMTEKQPPATPLFQQTCLQLQPPALSLPPPNSPLQLQSMHHRELWLHIKLPEPSLRLQLLSTPSNRPHASAEERVNKKENNQHDNFRNQLPAARLCAPQCGRAWESAGESGGERGQMITRLGFDEWRPVPAFYTWIPGLTHSLLTPTTNFYHTSLQYTQLPHSSHRSSVI